MILETYTMQKRVSQNAVGTQVQVFDRVDMYHNLWLSAILRHPQRKASAFTAVPFLHRLLPVCRPLPALEE